METDPAPNPDADPPCSRQCRDTNLGSGSYGEVNLRRECAVKRTDMFDGRKLFDTNMIEANIAASLRDTPRAHLICVHSVEVDSHGTLQISMERGLHDLDGYLNGLPVEQRLLTAEHCAIQIHAGLASLHDMGIMHGDLKPGNIMIVGENDHGPILRLIDFGASRTTHNRGGPCVQKVDCGTYHYAAPESLRSPQVPTKGWDAWGLGCIIHLLIYGHDLLDVPVALLQDPEAFAEAHAHVHARAKSQSLPLNARFGDCPPGVSATLFTSMEQLLEYDPRRRAFVHSPSSIHLIQLLDPRPLRPAVFIERRGVVSWFYRTYNDQRPLIPLAINMLDRYCDTAGWPVSESVRQSCMWLANCMLTPGVCQMRAFELDRNATMHVARTLAFRLYADTLLSLLFLVRGHKEINHGRVRQILCEETRASRGADLYECRPTQKQYACASSLPVA